MSDSSMMYVCTNWGFLPLATYRNLMAQQEGYKDYEEMEKSGKTVTPQRTYVLKSSGPVRVSCV